MSFMQRIRMLTLLLTLQIGVTFGVPMRPEEIEELFRAVNQPKIESSIPGEPVPPVL